MTILVQTGRRCTSEMPPRENQRVNISLDSVHASGPLGTCSCVLRGACNYKQTGLLQAYAAYSLRQRRAATHRLRLGLPGVRAPRAARRAQQSAVGQLGCRRAPLQPSAAAIEQLNGAGVPPTA